MPLVILVLCVAGCSGGAGKRSTPTTSASTRQVSAPSTAMRHASLADCECAGGWRVSFDYPQSLDVDPIHVDEHYVQIVGYVSNRKLHDPCRVLPNGKECGFPLEKLSNGGVLVQWSFAVPVMGVGNGFRDAPGAPTVVNGRPAKLSTSSASSSVCTRLGGVRTVVAVIGLPQSETVDMLACLGTRASSEASAVSAMFRSVRVNKA